MSSGLYKSLPLEPNATRMVRLLPDKEKNAEIEGELFTYDLTEVEGKKHLYEALSYVWSGDQEGGAEKRKEIKLLRHTVPITANLHAALVNLRDHQIESVLWVDAICINQNDLDEKNKQIPLMRTIYAQANRVIIWLGEAFQDGDKALETIRDLAERKAMSGKGADTKLSRSNRESCLKLLQRKWFRRIWVLQEAGVARSIEIMCGSVQINGYTFCEGLSQIEIPSLLRLIHPVLYLIRGAQFRPRNASRLRGSLYIGELIGLAADDPTSPGLQPDYNLPWHQVFHNTIQYILSGEGSVETFPDKETAIIHTKCWILGCVYPVEGAAENNRQKLMILFNDSPESAIFESAWGSEWMIQASTESVERVIPVSEQVLKAAVGSIGHAAPLILETLLRYQDNFQVTEEVVKVVAANMGFAGPSILEQLFKYQDNIPITEEVIEAAAGNKGYDGSKILEMLLSIKTIYQLLKRLLKPRQGMRGMDL
ncbi:heterokaryon incompatibility protein-domain-containing protein [Aspergillus arachidicola]|uniref:Heterokaryon incompatibility protein-domain-containing protein n=1 Tax=Aspergillus arachidicola TaxID=656916 RepID=A0A5N6YD57_9EURO|nr:heterokaryon incompatibility protein-domain-containing protein [Aspergillus arachidicola]